MDRRNFVAAAIAAVFSFLAGLPLLGKVFAVKPTTDWWPASWAPSIWRFGPQGGLVQGPPWRYIHNGGSL